jgi:hypothetical protein
MKVEIFIVLSPENESRCLALANEQMHPIRPNVLSAKKSQKNDGSQTRAAAKVSYDNPVI